MNITDALAGRTVEYVLRNEDGTITIVCDRGREVTLKIEAGQIASTAQVNTKIILPGLSVFPERGL